MAVEIRRETKSPLDWALGLLGMSRRRFEQVSGLSKGYLLRVSQGRGAQMGQTVTGIIEEEAKARGVDLSKELFYSVYGQVHSLEEAYERWQVQHRKSQEMPPPARDPELNPFMRLVKAAGGYSRMSALLAVSDLLVTRYAKGETYRMPMPIMFALSDMGYEHIHELDNAMQKWGEANA